METTHNVDNTTMEQEQRSQVDRTWAATLAKCQPQQDAPGRTDAAFLDDPILDSVRKLLWETASTGYERGAIDMLHNVKELIPAKYGQMLLDRVKTDADMFANRVQQRKEAQQ